MYFIFTATKSSAESKIAKPPPNKVSKTNGCVNETIKRFREMMKKQECMYQFIIQYTQLIQIRLNFNCVFVHYLQLPNPVKQPAILKVQAILFEWNYSI